MDYSAQLDALKESIDRKGLLVKYTEPGVNRLDPEEIMALIVDEVTIKGICQEALHRIHNPDTRWVDVAHTIKSEGHRFEYDLLWEIIEFMGYDQDV